ncbi:hypothetical protein CP533_2311 [Ophiocordyceps camponoti-saundersi (nom. inval.)]|nr:hypothetical protein CP533_2311 [Ophiocordyceps camponoti-saundersi (nom. inval.)]
MHLTKALTTALAAFLPLASAAAVVKKADETWSLNKVTRKCVQDNSACTWNFEIDNGSGIKTPCEHTTKSQAGRPASQSHGGPTFCGVYRLESSWDGTHGVDNAFSVIGVLDQSRMVIGYFGYQDAEVVDGRVVIPNHVSVIKPFSQKAIF